MPELVRVPPLDANGDAPVIGLAGRCARVLVALAAFTAVGLVMRAVAAPSGGGVISAKLEYWDEHGREYDTLFLGSSHVLRAFVPEEFDRRMADAGAESRSYNFGVQAVHLIEQRYLLQRILDASQGALRRVYFEYQWLTPQIDPQNAFAPRTVYWHDWDSTELAMQRALHWGEELGPEFRFDEDEAARHSLFDLGERCLPPGLRAAEGHLEHFATNALMIGRGKDVTKGLLGRASGQAARYAAQRGYVALEDEERVQGEEQNSYRLRRERFLEHQQEYLEQVAALQREPVTFGDGEWVNAELQRVEDLELVRRIAHEVEERGVQFILVLLPSQSCDRPFEQRLARELGAPVLRYNDPARYPEFYALENRYDSGHFSAAGAQRFSERLVQDTLALNLCPPGCEDEGAPEVEGESEAVQ